jgi:hypothetical protein
MGMGWRALGVLAMATGTLSSNGCGMIRCENVVIVHAPDELNNPSVGTLGLLFGDAGYPAEGFAVGERTVRMETSENSGFESEHVFASLRMPDGTSFHGSANTEQRDASIGGGTCLVTEIQLEPSDP